MKLRILVVAAGCLLLPAMASAQVPATDTTAKPTKIDTSGPQTAGCPMGCPTSRGAAGLTGVQFLALQQELRDRGCGNGHVTGHLDAPTRKAISVCAKQLNVANSAEAVLAALNIGFGPGDNAPTGGAATSGTGAAREGTKAEEAGEKPSTERAEARAAARRTGTRAKPCGESASCESRHDEDDARFNDDDEEGFDRAQEGQHGEALKRESQLL